MCKAPLFSRTITPRHLRKLAVRSRMLFLLQGLEKICDTFCGGGGAAVALEEGTGRDVDDAINHNPEAICMHAANHPRTRHWMQDIRDVNPWLVAAGRPIGALWASPDCKHFSKAKGSKPLDRRIRDLAWNVCRWAKRVRPRVIFLENVEEFVTWGPLDPEGRPIAARKGEFFRAFVKQLEFWGYRVEWRELRASEYGAPTIRKRLFLVARCDGRPIVWPKATHGPGLRPLRTAAEIIDWSIPCPSIFGRKRPLAENTLARIAKGIQRYVIEAPEPFIISYYTDPHRRVYGLGEPLGTATTENRFGLAVPFFAPRYGERPTQEPRCQDAAKPISTIVPTGNGANLVAAFMAQHNRDNAGHGAREPVSTLTQTGSQQSVVVSHLSKFYGTATGHDVREPVRTITASGWHIAEVRAFLMSYYGTQQDTRLAEPLPTATTKHRFGLVTVAGIDWQIVDIGMRMLSARELFLAQGFPESYCIDPEYNGKPLTKTAQIRCCGNSVSPPPAVQLVRANFIPDDLAA